MDGWTVLTGDEQIRRRSAQPLMEGLRNLGVGDTDIMITELNERPYVRMTLNWLDSQGIVYDIDEAMTRVKISTDVSNSSGITSSAPSS